MRKPKLRFHKPSKRYLVRLNGKDCYIGTDQVEAEKQYHTLMLDWVTHGGKHVPPRAPDEMLVCEIIERYVIAMDEYYKQCPRSFDRGRAALRYLNQQFGHWQPRQFDMAALRRLRDTMVESGRHCRNEVNRLMREVNRFWKYAASHEYAPAEIHAKCITLEPLQRGRCSAPETLPVEPVPIEHVEAVKQHVNRSVAAMIDLQLLTGARPGEVVGLRAEDIDRDGEVWRVELKAHKTAHRGKTLTLYLGQKAQAVLRPFLLCRQPGEHLFSPKDYVERRRENATCPRRPGQASAPRQTERTVGDTYTTAAYRRAITRACKRAGVPHWHPHQLRHTAATELRKNYGVEVARAVLGHAHVAATEIYAEADQQVAARVAAERG